jgi:DNA-binding HxlR family transcriptional regulator
LTCEPRRASYSLLIVREIGYGYRRFSDLAGFTGAPRDILTSRLRRLEEIGLIERRLPRARAAR